MQRLFKITSIINQGFSWIAGIALVVALGLTVADVIAIKAFSSPIPGAIEYVSFLSVIVIAFSIAYTQQLKGHIQVEFFVSRLPTSIRAITGILVCTLGIILFTLLAWRSFEYGNTLRISGEVSMTQRIPFYPFVYAIAFCCIPVCLQLTMDLLVYLNKLVNR